MKNLSCLNGYYRSEATRVLAKRRLLKFLLYDGEEAWQTAPHLELVCNKLHEVVAGTCKRLMVFMPPRNGKSEIVSKKFPAWYLGNNPDKEIILSSYSVDLARDFSRIARDTLKKHSELFGEQVARDNSGVEQWGIEGKRGGLVAAGVGTGITGRGSEISIIDDPFKNWQEAASVTIRNNVWEWYKSTLRTRLSPTGAIILVMTRWHEDDLAGRLLQAQKEGGEQWEVISLPACAEAGDILGRPVGEYLWLNRFSKQFYEDAKKALGSMLWAALYQQRPSPASGQVFQRHWWKYYSVMPTRFDEIIQSWDCAFKDLTTSDYVVGQVWGRIGADKYLLDQTRGKLGITATMQAIVNMTAKWPKARRKLVEDKANGTAVIELLTKKIPGLVAIEPEGGKIVRAQAVTPDIESGNVYLPNKELAPWIDDFIEEAAVFPNGKNDDQIDAATQVLNYWIGKENEIKPELIRLRSSISNSKWR